MVPLAPGMPWYPRLRQYCLTLNSSFFNKSLLGGNGAASFFFMSISTIILEDDFTRRTEKNKPLMNISWNFNAMSVTIFDF